MHDLTSATDPRLAPYSRVGDAAWLLSRGLFVAEGRLVVERLMDAKRFTIESILVTPSATNALALRLAAVGAEVLVCSPETMKQVTGFNFHRGCLALARRPPIAPIDSWLERNGRSKRSNGGNGLPRPSPRGWCEPSKKPNETLDLARYLTDRWD